VRRAFEVSESAHRACERCRRQTRFSLLLPNGNDSALHAGKCEAYLPVANGNIFVPQFQIHVSHARECKAVLAMVDERYENKFIPLISNGLLFSDVAKPVDGAPLANAISGARLLWRVGQQIRIAVVDARRLAPDVRIETPGQVRREFFRRQPFKPLMSVGVSNGPGCSAGIYIPTGVTLMGKSSFLMADNAADLSGNAARHWTNRVRCRQRRGSGLVSK